MARRSKRKAKVLGLWEDVLIRARDGKRWQSFKAKLDTGAGWSRIGAREAAMLRLGPIVEVRTIRTSGGGKQRRVVVPAKLRLGGYRIAAHFTMSTGKPGIVIGRRTIGKRFTIDPKGRYLAKP